jgi:hypothetical protein
MSIVALKRKAAATIHSSLANGQKSFSLNGTHRNQGYVGQTSLSRSLPRTLMRGIGYRGSGGCCGKFPIGPRITSSIFSTEDPSVVKSSVVNTEGLIHTKYKYIWRAFPYSSFKTHSKYQGTQELYIENLKRKTIACVIATKPAVSTTPAPKKKCKIHFSDKNKFDCLLGLSKDITGRNGNVATSQGEYLSLLSGKCNNLVSTKFSINGTTGGPLPGPGISR